MKTALCLLVSALIFTLSQNASADDFSQQIAAANTKFACDLYGHLKTADGNLFFSPFSISTALAMTQVGAGGQTGVEMRTVLGLAEIPSPPTSRPSLYGVNDSIGAGFHNLLQNINKNAADGIEISNANALWGQNGFAFQENFIHFIGGEFSGTLTPVDFGNPPAAAKTINDWVAQQTHDKIKDLLNPEQVKDARLVLTNAIYFKGSWADAFDKKLTADAPFKQSPDKQDNIPMMHADGTFGYFQDDAVQVLEMPYKGNTLSMLVLLPRKDLAEVEKNLTPQYLGNVANHLQQTEVTVTVPKFKMEQKQPMKEVLKAMGMSLAFESGKADFTGIASQGSLYISEVIHQAFVNVDEEGTEAAAATAVVVTPGGAAPQAKPRFVADHPFVFVIRDNASGSILFFGRVQNPKE